MITLPKTTLVLVDDHALFRLGVRWAIEENTECPEIIGECASGKEFYAMLEKNTIPDLALLDIILPDTSGIEIARYLREKYPQVKIIVLSSEVSEDVLDKLLEIDVDGYLSKLAHKQDIFNAIRSVLSGNHYYGQSVSRIMYNVYVAKRNNPEASKKVLFKKEKNRLTSQEINIIHYLSDGYTAKEVAEKMHLSARTVETHKSNILKKLGFNSIAEVIKYAIKHGIVEWE